MLSSSTIFGGQHEYTSTWALGRNGGSILQNEAWHLPVAVANRHDRLIWGYQGGCERQRLHQVQGDQAQVWGPRWYRTCARRRRRLCFPCRRRRRSRHRHPRHPAGRGRRAAPCGEEPPPAPSPAARGGGGKGRAGGGAKKASGKASGQCRLNWWAWTWLGMTPGSSQSQPAGQPDWRIKKLHPKGYINVRTCFNNVCTFHEMYVAICTLNMSYTTLHIQGCTLYVHVYMIQNMYIIV